MSDLERPAPTTPTESTNEPFDVWWPKYIDRVRESVTAAEQYLEVPAGTISSIPQDPDFIAIVKTYAVIEPMLNDLIAARSPKTVFGTLAAAFAVPEPDDGFQAFVAGLNIGGRVGKVALAKSLGLLKEDQVRFVEGVARIRNRYAHNVKNMHRSFADILTEEQNSNAKIVGQITGLQIKLPSPTLAPHLKLFMYHRLADYLSDALHTLKPPPFPVRGILSGLLGAIPDDAQS
jgi:hypothetical protein